MYSELYLPLRKNRPIANKYQPTVKSDSLGKTWEPYTHGPFWAAANNAISTSSGVLIFGGRYPDIGIQISYESASPAQSLSRPVARTIAL